MCLKKPKQPKQQVAASAAPPPNSNTAQVKSYVKSEATDNAQGFGPGVGDLPNMPSTNDGSGISIPKKDRRRKGIVGLEI